MDRIIYAAEMLADHPELGACPSNRLDGRVEA